MTSRAGHAHDSRLFLNRELSWLAFNERVLAEAENRELPLLERVKFAAIAASNLDEFFMVRVAALKRAIEAEDPTPDLAGRTPLQQLADVAARTQAFVARLSGLVANDLLPSLAAHGIRLMSWSQLDADRRAALGTYFSDAVQPVLTPLAIDTSRPFPLLSSLSLNLALRLEPAPGETASRLAVVQVPSRLTRLVRLAAPDDPTFVLLEDIIRAHLPTLFPGQSIIESAVIRLARDAELEFDDEGGRTQLDLVERQVRRRRRSDIVRLEAEASASKELIALLSDQLDVEASDVYVQPGPLDLRLLMGVIDLPGFDALRDPPHQPADMLSAEQTDLFSVLDERDILLHHPYDCYDPVLALLAQAAEDPDVLAIKQTLYRASARSSIIRSLQRAAECNKQVTVLVELTARFDEERNIQWARSLEEAGAHVIYGVRGYKTHAKICLIVRRGAQGLRRYLHLGTGNYNEQTARVYTDFSLMTSSAVLAEDASAFFSAVTGYSDPPRLKKLVMAPTDLRGRFLKLINRERRRAEAGRPGEIVAKMNSLIDDEIIEALYAASQHGVQILLNVRGICALKPGVAGVSERIGVVSIVDRFLEHARVFYFHNGGDDEVYLASADWMTRNLDKRLELMWPVEAAAPKARVIATLRAMFRDTAKAWWLTADGTYERRPPRTGEPPFRVQQHLQDEARRAAAVARDAAGIRLVPQRNE
jgi:polyphosphate kinase